MPLRPGVWLPYWQTPRLSQHVTTLHHKQADITLVSLRWVLQCASRKLLLDFQDCAVSTANLLLELLSD